MCNAFIIRLLFCGWVCERFRLSLSVIKKKIRYERRMIASTDAKDSWKPTSYSWVGLISSNIIAASESVLSGLALRRKISDRQKNQQIIAALSVGALGGTINRNRATEIAQTIALEVFSNPATLQSHQMIAARMPRCIPDRLIKCSRPVLLNAL